MSINTVKTNSRPQQHTHKGARASIEIPMSALLDRNDKKYYVSVDTEVDLNINLLDWVIKVFPNEKEDGRSHPRMFLTPRKLDEEGNPINPVPHYKRVQQEVDPENGVDFPEASKS